MIPVSDSKTDPAGISRIVGGLFGLECALHPAGESPIFLMGREVFTVNARSGLWLLVNRLRPPRVWVPSYLCHTILSAIDPGMTTLRYYEVNYDLHVASGDWVSEVQAGDLVLFIDYFGFPYDRELGDRVKRKGAWVLEDASQALLSGHVGNHSDFVLYSPRKWIGLPDGGILRFPDSIPLDETVLQAPRPSWWLKALHATILRRQFDEGHPSREWFRLYREAEESAPTGPYAMSQLSRNVIEYCADFSAIAGRRVENYRRLLTDLADYAVFPVLEAGVVPLGFPVRVGRRDEVREALFRHEIYPPVHWLIEGVVPSGYEDSHRLSRTIMTIPCDQRYTEGDMERVIRTFVQQARRHS